ncbi:DNA helicase [Verrucomicrobia bacterium LW23]|nr:DNA helicase [Verrucomicrobia bacterium LW23]
MNILLSATFTDSLGRLTGDEQKATKMTAFDLQLNPAGNGMSFHKLDKAKDKHFWSVRVNKDIRLIVHKSAANLLLCYVDHHDKAYTWAECRKLETHPHTGAAQLVEIRETVKEIVVPTYVHKEVEVRGTHTPGRPLGDLFSTMADVDLLSYGVPPEWLDDVRGVTTEDALLAVAGRLPAEAGEALLELATGGKPKPAAVTTGDGGNPFDHPDAQRRFRVMANVEELQRALEFPWDKWSVFLHPDQRQSVEREYRGPARVSGSAGTGKTIVALHRTVWLARSHPEARVLLTTFSPVLAEALRVRVRRLVSNEPRLAERIDVEALDSVGTRLYRAHCAQGRAVALADASDIGGLIAEAIAAAGPPPGGRRFTPRFLAGEWEGVVDAWQLDTWEGYRDVPRLGRRTRLSEAQRRYLWGVFAVVRAAVAARGLVTQAEIFTRVAPVIREAAHPVYDFAVVDEAQDMGVAQLRFLAALARRPDALFFTGDQGQRIFQQPFSWAKLGVDLRGRSRTLRVNYRTSHQIRTQADRLLGDEVTEMDGDAEKRDAISVFNGPAPEIQSFADEDEEIAAVAAWLRKHSEGAEGAEAVPGIPPHEFAIFVRSEAELPRAEAAAQAAELPAHILTAGSEATPAGAITLSTMHLAKGLEFRAVAVMACDDEIIPLQERIESIAEEADLEEVYNTERHLLYVACTRARDHLLVSGTRPLSEFLEDLIVK